MTFTIEQLERYVQAIDLYESDEAQWLRDKRLEKGGLLAIHNPEMTKIVLAVDDAKTELAVNSVEIARQLIAEKKAHGRLKEELGKLINLLDGQRYGEAGFYEGVKFAQHECRDILTRILEGTE